MRISSFRRAAPWLGLACILISYVGSIIRLHPTNFFGLTEDDSIYFSSAQALAQGKGYILPSVPGAPTATKYPILYPWILSWVWRWNPFFPSNLAGAVGINVAFGAAFITAAFILLRGLGGIGEGEALLLTAFCALHPLSLYYSSSVLSDVPFAALALAAMIVGDRATKPGAGVQSAALCGILTGLSILMRVFGIPVAAGIVATALLRRASRQLLVFGACVFPFVAVLFWHIVLSVTSQPQTIEPIAADLGWIQTWTFYSSYLAAWQVSVPNIHILWAMLISNAEIIFRSPSNYFLFRLFAQKGILGGVVVGLMTPVIIKGIVRQARQYGAQPIHYVLPAYSLIILVWNYPIVDRFLLPFLPLFAAGIWFEGSHVLRMVRSGVRNGRRASERALAAGFAVVIAAIVCGIAFRYVSSRGQIFEQSAERAALMQEKREVYQWLSHFSAHDARVIAYEDASAYLYTGRSALRPIMFTTDELYEPARLGVALGHMTDVARVIRADYWIVAEDDFGVEWSEATIRAQAHIEELERVLPMVYQSQGKRVRIYSLACLRQHPDRSSCRSSAELLLPMD
jgi:4-amino-4-deoxy-L-arabinose transferase-like glycosyltransferase